MNELQFFIDPARCIGCRSCENACAECETHRGIPMIHVDYIDRERSIATTPMICMHCENPTCAQVCPADAIKQNDEGIVMSSLKPRCIACANCALACPFGVPKILTGLEQMMKCDMCFDRTSVGKRPMCATVCPSQALAFVSPDAIRLRREVPTNVFRFGAEEVRTKVQMMVPRGVAAVEVDVVDYMWEASQ